MEEFFKNRAILILSTLCIILLIGMVGSCSNAYRMRIARDKEMSSRIDLENKINKILQEKTIQDAKAKTFEKELEEKSFALEEARKALKEEQSKTADLREELDKLLILKEALEEDLKEALTNKASGKSKR